MNANTPPADRGASLAHVPRALAVAQSDVPTDESTDEPGDIARDIAAVGRLEALPTLLAVLCETTGMGFTAVARVTEKTWTLCAVKDEISFGLKPGGQLELETTLCIEAKRARSAIIIDHASQDPRYRDHHTPKFYKIESYVSVPIIFSNGRYFGNLCAIDPRPAKVLEPKVIGMFQRFATLIAHSLENELRREESDTALSNERADNELRDQFIAILGHDLRNPLQSMLVTSAVIERKSTDADIRDMAARITKSGRRMTALISDILDFAQGTLGGGIGVNIDEGINIKSALSDVVKELQSSHAHRQVIVDIQTPHPVRCDIDRLQQLASNLVGNALTHGDANSVVRVSATTDDRELILTVANQGEPIPADLLTKIFNPFWRQSTGGHRTGLGLGLNICSQIVRAHHGTLSVTSTREAGTIFTARLPL
jgi:signal transduction histidine kinase